MVSQKGAESLINLLLELLERHPDGLRSDQIRTAFGRQGLNFSLADITGTLRGLMEINGIRFQKQRWISVKAKAGDSWVQTAQLPPAKCPRTERSHQTAEHSIPAIFTNNKISAIPFRPIRAKNDTAYDQVPMQSGSLPSDWNLLRSLIPYYRECLRVEERPNMLVGSEKFGERFLALTTAGRWWPEESESVSFTLDAQNLPSGFLKALARRGDDEIFLGYPVSTIPTKDGGTLIQPIFTLNCQIEMKSGGVNILIPSQGPDLNAGWLEKNFKHNSEAQKFLNWIGIRNAGDISDLESSVNDEFVDIGTAAARYRAFVGEEKCDRLIPEAPSLFIKTGIGKALSQNAIILFLSDLTRYSRGAIRELDTLATWDLADLEKSSLRNLFSRKVEKQTGHDGPVFSPIELNEDQLNAAREALNSDLTVITGPPGTGKSQTVAAIMASVALDGGNALLASKNHKAIDAIEERLNELTGDRVILARANRQWGSQRAFDLKASVNAMISRNAEPGAYERHRYRLAALKDMESKRWGLHDGLVQRKRLERLIADKYEQISIIRTKFGGKVFDWAQSQETDVGVMELLPKRTWLMNLPIIGAWIRNRRHKAFITRLNNKGIPWTELGFERIGPEHIDSIAGTIEKLMECRRLQVEVSSLNRDLEKLPETEDTLDRLMTLNQEIMNHSSELFEELPNVLDELTEFEKQEMVEFKGSVSVLDSKDASVALQVNKLWSRAMPVVLKHFPLWAVTNLSAASRLPFQAAMFDYVIIDEASVCDIPSALPLMARAKRAVIVGDPAQLQHVTKISVDRERELLIKNDLLKQGIGRFTHRENSLYHIAASGSNTSPHLLREHYRCHEEIADYFNQTFYGGRLRVRTDVDRLIAPPGVAPGIHWTEVTGPIVPAKSGCYAPNEIDSIVVYLKDLMDKGQFKGTLGVVTAFREQAIRIMDRISDIISPEKINQANLGAYTAHQFQGDARDVIILSLCAGPDIPAGSFAFLASTANLMNVAVSRAKAVCHVFGNRCYAKECGIPHVVALASAAEKSNLSNNVSNKFESPWEKLLYDALLSRGIEPIPQYPLAGRRLDLAIVRDRIKLDVEIDGEAYHRDADGLRKSSDLWRDHQIKSLGWGVKRFWVYQLRENMEACVDDIFKALEP